MDFRPRTLLQSMHDLIYLFPFSIGFDMVQQFLYSTVYSTVYDFFANSLAEGPAKKLLLRPSPASCASFALTSQYCRCEVSRVHEHWVGHFLLRWLEVFCSFDAGSQFFLYWRTSFSCVSFWAEFC